MRFLLLKSHFAIRFVKSLECTPRIVLLLGDVKINPGPLQYLDNQTSLPVDSLLNFRLTQLGFIALDVGVAGNRF